MNTIVYTFSFPHHGRYSSYHRLAHYLPDCQVIDISLRVVAWLPPRIRNAVSWRWLRANEWRLYPHFRKSQPHCFHYLHPENSLSRATRWKGRHKLVLTCHQPASFLGTLARTGTNDFLAGLAEADGVILLSRSSLADYQSFAPRARREFIPHGVDVHFFQPGKTPSTRPLILTVGNWLRDYACWAEVVRCVSKTRPDIEFAVLANAETQAAARQFLGNIPANVVFLSGLSDVALRQLYRETMVAFVPVKDAIANNAVIEALAMGLPLVATDLPAVREYAGDAALYIDNSKPAMVAEILSSLVADPARRIEMGADARRRAEQFLSWDQVAERLRQFYSDLIKQ